MTKIATLREKKADQGSILIGHKVYRKSHSLNLYITGLRRILSLSTTMPMTWGDYKPRELLQQLVFQLLEASQATRREQEMALQEISQLMQTQMEFISTSFQEQDTTIQVYEVNVNFFQLQESILAAENLCVRAHDDLEFEAVGLNENAIYMLKKAISTLEILVEWVTTFIWATLLQITRR